MLAPLNHNPSPAPPPLALARSEAVEIPAPPAPAVPEAPADSSAPEAEAFPPVLESFLYRYQLDMEFAFAFAGADGDLPAPAPAFRPGQVEPGSRRSVIMSVFREVRIFQGRAFVQQTDRLAGQLSPPTAGQLRHTSRNLARKFSLDFSLSASFLQQFASQSRALAGRGEETFNRYLDISDTLTLRSGQEVQSFFDQVDELLAGAQDTLHEQVGGFLRELGAQLDREEAQAMGDLLHRRIDAFFATAAEFLDQAEAQFADFTASEESPPPELPAAPDTLISLEPALA